MTDQRLEHRNFEPGTNVQDQIIRAVLPWHGVDLGGWDQFCNTQHGQCGMLFTQILRVLILLTDGLLPTSDL